MKLPLVYTDLCCKQVFKNATTPLLVSCEQWKVASCRFWWLFHLVQGCVVWFALHGLQESVYYN